MWDIRVVVEEVLGFCDLPMQPGDYFEVRGGAIHIPDGKHLCLWALQAMMPLLPLKQRNIAEENDWVPRTRHISCPDPNGRVIYRIDRIGVDDEAHADRTQDDNRTGIDASPDRGIRRMVVNEAACSGCRACELTCSFEHGGEINPAISRIRVEKDEPRGLDRPLVCRQCGNARCVAACPVGALSRDPETFAVSLDSDACTGCKACARACPFGSIAFHPVTGKPLFCDLCGGEPACVKRCPVDAIRYDLPGR